MSALTAAAGINSVKRIFKELSDGSLLPPSIPESTEQDQSMMQVDLPIPPPPMSVVPSRSFFLPSTSASGSIAHFLEAHPDPLTEEQLAPLCITASDFTLALKQVQPSSMREGFATVPDVTWADIGALHGTREELHMAIVQPIKRPELFSEVGIEAACGVLLWGPPGCGKTLLAKAVANESRANFISVKGPELLNKVTVNYLETFVHTNISNSHSTSVKASAQLDKCSPVHEHPRRVSSFLTSWMHSFLDETITWYDRIILACNVCLPCVSVGIVCSCRQHPSHRTRWSGRAKKRLCYCSHQQTRHDRSCYGSPWTPRQTLVRRPPNRRRACGDFTYGFEKGAPRHRVSRGDSRPGQRPGGELGSPRM